MLIQFCADCGKKLNRKRPAKYCRSCRWKHEISVLKKPQYLCKCGNRLSAKHVKQCIKCRLAPSVKYCLGCNKRLHLAIRKWCHDCYMKELSKMAKKQTGVNNKTWNGGITKHSRGYVYIKNRKHPRCKKFSYIFEHVLVMEKHLGRYLKPDEVIHHINGIKSDNRIENLELMTKSSHAKLHMSKRTLPKRDGRRWISSK